MMENVQRQLAEGSKIKAAVQQLEEQMKGLPATLENKIKAVRAIAWDAYGNYRGLFTSEEDARCFGLCVMARVGGDADARSVLAGEMKGVFERAMGGSPTEVGGAAIPIEYARRIQRLVEQFGVWGRDAFPMPMTSDKLTFSRRTSGLTVFKTGQNVAATASEMGFESVNLNADEWNVLALYPKAMDVDSAGAVGELVMMEIVQAMAYTLDLCGFIGDGTPANLDVHGITTRLVAINGVDDGGGLVLGSGAGGAGWTSLDEDDFNKTAGQLPAFAGIMPKWYTSNKFFWTVMNPINNAKGGVTKGEFQGKQTLMFLGSPVEITQVMPSVAGNSQVCALYGDLRLSSTHGYVEELSIEENRSVKFLERQVAVLGTQRHAVNNHSLGSATEAGAVVGLITPAAG
jgi:HK97 family phage major capsid protein